MIPFAFGFTISFIFFSLTIVKVSSTVFHVSTLSSAQMPCGSLETPCRNELFGVYPPSSTTILKLMVGILFYMFKIEIFEVAIQFGCGLEIERVCVCGLFRLQFL